MAVAEACSCGARFALGLMRCPRCRTVAPLFASRVKEEAMPRITVAGGPSNPGAEPGEVGYVGPEPEEAAEGMHMIGEGDGHHGASGLTVLREAPEPAPDYASMTQAALREEAKNRGLPVGGSKADLAARLADHDAEQQGADA